MGVVTDTNNFLAYIEEKYPQRFSLSPSELVLNSLIYALASGGGLTTGGTGTVGGATEAKQDDAIAELVKIFAKNEEIRVFVEEIKNAIAPTTALATPSLTVVNNTTGSAIANTISNAKYVSIYIKSGTGTILGETVDTAIASIDFPFLERGWDDISYTVDPNSTFVVLTAS